ncbi:MAG: Glu-tRNA(Gln) amidotransferase subunit GatE [candidate division Zixibacteria bacterium]|nr:Glu-tRNA(Gln) amidotransferase subunit GatE [candidate division Zixibacteria bacterium]
MQQVGFVPRQEATLDTYRKLGFKCGLEIHQQLLTASKLFCRCPAGIYQRGDDYDAEVIRHMRPTLSEMGEYDGTALMERKTRKNIFYRLKYETACTYEVDDTPPFKIDPEALEIAIELGLLLKSSMVGELHITRKQYLDGSIPTGFQRTAIVGIEGEIPLWEKKVRIIQLSIEEDSCREVSDIGHDRVYTTDRLGMPLVEMVTYPEMLTPDEAAEAGQYLRFLARSSGKVRTGIGAARQDVNVSVTGGTRVEIKGVAHIAWIPELTHIEAYRQKALLAIRQELQERFGDATKWKMTHADIDRDLIRGELPPIDRCVAVNLPGFAGILSHFTQPGKIFANEIRDRLKVIACLERPNLVTSEQLTSDSPAIESSVWSDIKVQLGAQDADAQLVFWCPEDDLITALETIEERCLMAFEGVPEETRKGFPDGTTIFERVLPGPDRMYPDTDSAPLSIPNETIERIRKLLPPDVVQRMTLLRQWKVPLDCHLYLLRKNLVPVIERISNDFKIPARNVGLLFGHRLRHLDNGSRTISHERLYELFSYLIQQDIRIDFAAELLASLNDKPEVDIDRLSAEIGFKKATMSEIVAHVPPLLDRVNKSGLSPSDEVLTRWIMGQLRPFALGNVSLCDLRAEVERMVKHG